MAKMKMGKIPPIDGMMKSANEPMTGDEPMPHEVDSAIDTMAQAEAHKQNPKMMKAVHQATGKKILDLKSLRALAMKKSMAGE